MPYAPPRFPRSSEPPGPPPAPAPAPTLGQTLASVLASFFGVQSKRNRERDFKHGKASHFIVIGLLATAAFVLTLWAIVKLVMKFASP